MVDDEPKKKKSKPTVIVISGIGHCGTTLVYLFAKEYYGSFGESEMVTFMHELNSKGIDRNCIFKTHTRYPSEHKDLNVKTLYMFGDLFNVIPSYARRHTFHGKPICRDLFLDAKSNLNIEDNSDRDFFDYDVFRFREHFDNWNKPSKNPVMLVRYETMYDHLEEILKFLNINKKEWSNFPAFKKRKTDWTKLSKKTINRISKTYGETREYLNSMPDIIIPEIIKDNKCKEDKGCKND